MQLTFPHPSVKSLGGLLIYELNHHPLEIRPKLKTVSLLETMQATGLSRTYCGMIRRGVRVPQPRHWEALRILVD